MPQHGIGALMIPCNELNLGLEPIAITSSGAIQMLQEPSSVWLKSQAQKVSTN